MLKGLDPRLGAELLGVLRAMGHGDLLAVVDTNFPAEALARATVHGRVVRMDNLHAREAVAAILSVLPLDGFVDDHAARMQVVGAPDEIPPVQDEVAAVIARHDPRPLRAVERFAFYDLARTAFAIVQTGETRFYGCFALRKGVIAPEDAARWQA